MIRIAVISLLFFAGIADTQAVPHQDGKAANQQTFSVHLEQGSDWAPMPYENVRGVVLLQAIIGGQPATVLLDNGTDRTIVDADFAKRAGFKLNNSPQTAFAGTSHLSTRIASNVTLSLPHMLKAEGQMPALDLGSMSAALGRPIAAVIGGDILDRLAVMVRPERRQVSIVASGGITPGAGAVVIPVVEGNLVSATINERPVRLKIDLGSSGAVRLSDVVFDHVIPPQGVSSQGVQVTADGVTRPTRNARADLRIGTISAKRIPIDSGYSTSGADGLLGNGFLSHADTILDLQRKQLVLTSIRPPS